MKKSITIYHNSRCRKSREALQLLNEKNATYEVVEYLKTPLDSEKLKELLTQLDMQPSDLLRKNEAEYKELIKGKDLSEDEIVELMMAHPKLIERPIVSNGEKAVVARPADALLNLL